MAARPDDGQLPAGRKTDALSLFHRGKPVSETLRLRGARQRDREGDKRADQTAVSQSLCAGSRRLAIQIEQSSPVNTMIGRYRSESDQVRKHCNRLVFTIQSVTLTDCECPYRYAASANSSGMNGWPWGGSVGHRRARARRDQFRRGAEETRVVHSLIVPTQLAGGTIEHLGL